MRMPSWSSLPLARLAILAAPALATASGCSSHGAPAQATGGAVDASSSSSAPPTFPFTAEPPSAYVAKVKNLLVGLPPTDAEVQTVQADPTQLAPLIDGWMALPEYQTKMLTFFELAFQQTQVSIADFAEQTYPDQAAINGTTSPELLQNLRESFARTVIELNTEGSPLTGAVTTTRLMLTPALMEFYAFLDAWQVDDAGIVTDRFRAANPKLQITVEASAGPIPIAQTLDPTNANYMHWYDPDVANDANAGTGCAEDPIVYGPDAHILHYLLYGSLAGYKNSAGGACSVTAGTASAPQLVAADFTDWKMVTLRPPAAGESPTAFYDLPTLRSASELVLALPRLGFFTPGVFRQLADEHQQSDAGDHQPGADRGHRFDGRWHRSDVAADDPGSRHGPRREPRLLRVPPDARSDAVDPRGDLLVELPRADRPDVRAAAGSLRLPRGHQARLQRERPRCRRSRSTRSSPRPGPRSFATTRTPGRARRTTPSFSASSVSSRAPTSLGTRWSASSSPRR